jgi:hypothetical protein
LTLAGAKPRRSHVPQQFTFSVTTGESHGAAIGAWSTAVRRIALTAEDIQLSDSAAGQSASPRSGGSRTR